MHHPPHFTPNSLLVQEKYEVDGTERPCPYAGKQFKVILKYPTDYPFNGPEMKFETGKLLHPNVNNDTGEMCMEGIEGADLTVDKRAAHIVGFLAKPNVGNPQDDGTATMMMDKIEEYEAKAKEWAAKAPDAPSA